MALTEANIEETVLSWLADLGYRSRGSTLAAALDALLPRLLSGEVRVREAERVVGEAG